MVVYKSHDFPGAKMRSGKSVCLGIPNGSMAIECFEERGLHPVKVFLLSETSVEFETGRGWVPDVRYP